VLQHQQGVVNVMTDIRFRNHADNTAHDSASLMFLAATRLPNDQKS
jgi:hypothetical protein